VCELGDRRPALRGANHNHDTANDIVVLDSRHDRYDARHTGGASVDDKLIKHHQHDADARWRHANHHDDLQHDDHAG
jgi:hypothetical protein